MFDLQKIIISMNKPHIFQPGDFCFWTDEYISKQMLKAHLNPDIDAASRKLENIEQTVRFWLKNKLINPGDKVLDLGCGPGLYTERLAATGVQIVGIDQSEISLNYAIKQANNKHLSIEYRHMNFLDLNEKERYDAIIQVFGEFCTLSNADRDLFLANIFQALKPDGLFIMDVSTRKLRMKDGLKNNWYVSEGGFWSPGRHLVLEMGFDYPESDTWLDQYIVVNEFGVTTIYRAWFHDYSLNKLISVVEKANFRVETVWGDLTGRPYDENSNWIAVALRKKK
ncbi:MAG: class I SAM-dependent methyltransferase [Bacillota bacterium]